MPVQMSREVKMGIVDFANRSFRDVADRDYIAARECHRLGLDQQFLWMALQAVEKYIKGILLFSFRDTRPFGHHVKKAFDALATITDIPFSFPSDVADFVKYLEDQAANRYFTQPFFTVGEELLLLDKTVWHLRLYCQHLRIEPSVVNGKVVDWFALNVGRIQQQRRTTKPNSVRIFGGYLEKVIEGRDTLQRRAVTLKNIYFGRTNKRVLRNLTIRSSSAIPTHYLHQGMFAALDGLVKLEPHVRQLFLQAAQQNNPSP